MELNINNRQSLSVWYNRVNPTPLDGSSIYDSKTAADNYAASSPIAYAGQVVAVVAGNNVDLYKLVPAETGFVLTDINPKAAADSLADVADKMTVDNAGNIVYVTNDTYVYEDEDGKKVYSAELPADKKFDEVSAAEYNAAHADDEGFEPVEAGDLKPGVDVYGPGAYIISGDGEVEKLAQSNPGSADLDSEVAALKTKVDSKLDASVLDSETTFNFAFNPNKENELLLNIGGKSASIDLAKFAIDGMLQSVSLVRDADDAAEGVSVPYFEFTWNCDIDADYEGEQNVMRIELGDILDSAIADKADSSALAALRKEIFGEGEGDDRTEGLVDRISDIESALDADAEGSLASKVAALETGKADSDHNHDEVYSKLGHNHDDAYAALNHSHDIDKINGLEDRLSGIDTELDSIKSELGISDPEYFKSAAEYNEYYSALDENFTELSEPEFEALSDEDKIIPSDNKSISDRVSNIEDVLGDSESGLVSDVADLQTTVGDSTDGLVKDVDDLQTAVGDSNSGLVKDVANIASDVEDLKDAISATSGVMHFKGVATSLDDIESPVQGDVYYVGTIEYAYTGSAWVELGDESKNSALNDDQINDAWDSIFNAADEETTL